MTGAGTPPLLVTGLPRSGTSWVGKTLEVGRQVVYINEPMSLSWPPGHSPGVLDARVEHRFQYIGDSSDARWARAFDDTLRLRFRPLRELAAVRGLYHLAGACLARVSDSVEGASTSAGGPPTIPLRVADPAGRRLPRTGVRGRSHGRWRRA